MLIRPFSGFTLDRFSRRIVFLIVLVVYSLLFAGYLVAITVASIILLRFAQGLTWGFRPIIPASKRCEGIGYFALSTTVEMSIGPAVGLLICHQFGFIVMFVSGLFISLANLACAYTIRLPKRLLVGKRIQFNKGDLFDKTLYYHR